MAKDMLFATLDPTMRAVELPDNGPEVILSDTVGFISDLPTQLVGSFPRDAGRGVWRRIWFCMCVTSPMRNPNTKPKMFARSLKASGMDDRDTTDRGLEQD